MAAVSSGYAHTCALTTGGGVKCWGWNIYGQLGNGTTTDSDTPVDVDGLATGVLAITTGRYHTCALTTGGGVKCWGRDGEGQLGDGNSSNASAPVDVTGLAAGATAVSAGAFHVCALLDTGDVQCWGSNNDGQLGDGTTSAHSTPRDVDDLTDASAISAGVEHSCAVTPGGRVQCWGGNTGGQLGNDTMSNSATPTYVLMGESQPTQPNAPEATLFLPTLHR